MALFPSPNCAHISRAICSLPPHRRTIMKIDYISPADRVAGKYGNGRTRSDYHRNCTLVDGDRKNSKSTMSITWQWHQPSDEGSKPSNTGGAGNRAGDSSAEIAKVIRQRDFLKPKFFYYGESERQMHENKIRRCETEKRRSQIRRNRIVCLRKARETRRKYFC